MTTTQVPESRTWGLVSDAGFTRRFVAMEFTPRGKDPEATASHLREILTLTPEGGPPQLVVVRRNKGFSVAYVGPGARTPERLLDIDDSFNQRLREEFSRGATWELRKIGAVGGGRIHGSIRRTDVVHGTLSAYQNGRCRCPECTEANRLRHLERRGGYHPREADEDYHSGPTCQKRKCHCAVYQEWAAQRQRRYRAARRQK